MLLKQHGKGDGRPPSPFVRCSVFVGLILRDGVQIRLYIFGFLGPLGLDSGRLTTPFLKCVSSNFSKKTNNPNPSPIKKIWFGLYWFGAGGGTRTHTESPRRILNPLRLPFHHTGIQLDYYTLFCGQMQEKFASPETGA